jgi:thiol-disulfide isomerase/thioredoxin
MRLLIFATFLFSLCVDTLGATQSKRYSDTTFDIAQSEGRHILVYVRSSWCATCALQEPALAQLDKSEALADLTVFIVDFDLNKGALRRFRITAQSTFILFDRKREVGRLTGETDPRLIETFFDRASSHFAKAQPFTLVSYGLAFLAGIVSILSPCVLPLIPVALGAASSSHRFGPLALGGGFLVFSASVSMLVSARALARHRCRQCPHGRRRTDDRVRGRRSVATVAGPRRPVGSAARGHGATHPDARLADPALGPVRHWRVARHGVGTVRRPHSRQRNRSRGGRQSRLRRDHHAALRRRDGRSRHARVGAVAEDLAALARAVDSAGEIGHVVLGALLILIGTAILTGIDRDISTRLLQWTPVWIERIATYF